MATIPRHEREAWISEAPDAEAIRIPIRALSFEGFRKWAASDRFPRCARVSFLSEAVWITDWLEFPEIVVPVAARTLAGFCDWAESESYPRSGVISYLDREIVIDMSPEELESHNKVKTEVSAVIYGLNKETGLGSFYSDGVQVTNQDADLSTEPDASFSTWKSLAAGKVRRVAGKRRAGTYMRLDGSPDWVLEIVSDSSVQKDTRRLWTNYYRAGVREYWLIDCREEALEFTIFIRGKSGFVAVRPRDGWLRSRVFGRGFQLDRRENRQGFWEYDLHVKAE